MKRSAYFDNAKAILIYFVVLGHLLSSFLMQHKQVDTFYLAIYMFHMPAFIFISGHFSKMIRTKKDVIKIFKTLFIPYVIFQIIYTFYYKGVFGDDVEFALFEPRYALWFLLSMILWRFMLIVFGRHPIMIILAISMSLTIGYFGEVNEWFSLSRTFFFFPFFLAGYYFKRENFAKMKNARNIQVAILTEILLCVYLFYFGDIHWQEWLLGRSPYEEIRFELFNSDLLSRFFIYCLMFLATYTFLSLVPTKQYWFTVVGQRTLIVYLLHLFIIRALKETAFFEWLGQSWNVAYLIVIALAIVYVLSRACVARWTKPFMSGSFKRG